MPTSKQKGGKNQTNVNQQNEQEFGIMVPASNYTLMAGLWCHFNTGNSYIALYR